MSEEIAIFGGSFDPPHVGHLLAAAYVLATEPCDELWFVPVLAHPFGKPLVGSYDHRVALCEELARLLPRTRVSRAEQESGQARTVDLLEWLQRRLSNKRFALVLGTDLNAERAQWKQFNRVQQLARIITVQRGGHVGGAGSAGDGRSAEHGALVAQGVAIPEVSSTQVRALLKAGGDPSHLVPRPVLAAIRAAGTYR